MFQKRHYKIFFHGNRSWSNCLSFILMLALLGLSENSLAQVADLKPAVKDSVYYLFKNRKMLSYSFSGGVLNIQTNHGLVQSYFYLPKIVQLKNFPSGKPIADSSEAIIMKSKDINVNIVEGKGFLKFQSDSLQLIFHKVPFYASFVYHSDTILSEDKGFFERNDNEGLQFRIRDHERFFGLGERAVKSLKGNRFQLLNQAHYGYAMGEKNLNFSVPLLLSSRKYLLLFDNHEKGYVDIGKTNKEILEFGAIGGLMKYVFIAGFDYPDIYRSYGKLTGTQPLPPLWALGNLQSRMAYRSQQEADSIVRAMQQEDFPIDALILDFYWFGNNIKGYLGRLDWYKPRWPHPKEMIANFRKKGIKTVLITEPYIIDTLRNFKIANRLKLFATDSLGKTFINTKFYFGPAGLIDIFKPAAQHWFWKQYNRQIKIGVAGWWGDLGEPETISTKQYFVSGTADQVRNLYAFYWEKMLFENYRKYYPQTRLFDLNRAGYAGSQRFSVFPWSGDISRSWSGLQAQLPIMLNMSVSGFPFIHADAGGFAMGVKDNELYTRWLQFACFSPILRPHGSGIPSEPIFFNDTTRHIVRDFMKLRYRLLPYIYTAAWQAHKDGLPIVRPLFFEFPDDSIAYSIIDEYFFGEDFLVAPILHPGEKNRRVYLPKGLWYSWWNYKKYDGEKWITVPVKLETIPIFIRAGAFIPMVKAVNSTDDYSSQSLTVLYFPTPFGESSVGQMYEDDGKTFGAYENGNFQLLQFHSEKGRKFTFSVTGNGYKGMPIKREVTFKVIGGKEKPVHFTLRNGMQQVIIKN